MRNVFLLVCVFLFFFQRETFSKPIESKSVSKPGLGETDLSFKRPDKQKGGSLSKKSKNSGVKSKCNLFGKSRKALKSYVVSDLNSFLTKEDINDLLDMHLEDIKKGWPNKCPKHCQAINNYSVFGKSYPVSVSKDSCDKEEAKEIYHLSKKTVMGGDSKTDKQKAYKKTRDWMLAVFVKPFYPFSKNPPKEFIANNLGQACPSCSFYLEYTYKYTADNKLDLEVTANCSDRRTFFSKYKSEFFLINQWKCAEKKPSIIPATPVTFTF